MKNQKGITLIALVITIIVMLILVGITVHLIIGENGIMNQALLAKEKQKIAEITEKLELKKLDMASQKDNTILLKDYLEEIQKENAIINHTIELESKDKTETNAYIIVDGQYEYLLEQEENGNIKITYNGRAVLAESIILNKTQLTMEIETTENLQATVLPEKATNKAVRWESSNPEIATVENGEIKAIKQGDCTITATAIHGINKTATCSVHVIYPNLSSKAKIGDYVIYQPNSKQYTVTTSESGYSSNQTFSTQDATTVWQVLYNDTIQGLQITSSQSVITLNLGTEGVLASARIAYNNAITTLNTISNQYINSAYAISARSIGSNPSNPADSITAYYTVPSHWPSGSYTADEAAMKSVKGMAAINEEYFLASRYVEWDPSDHAFFCLRTINLSGNTIFTTGRIGGDSDGAGLSYAWMRSVKSGVRPVVTLISDIKVMGGTGSKDNPYMIEPKESR